MPLNTDHWTMPQIIWNYILEFHLEKTMPNIIFALIHLYGNHRKFSKL